MLVKYEQYYMIWFNLVRNQNWSCVVWIGLYLRLKMKWNCQGARFYFWEDFTLHFLRNIFRGIEIEKTDEMGSMFRSEEMCLTQERLYYSSLMSTIWVIYYMTHQLLCTMSNRWLIRWGHFWFTKVREGSYLRDENLLDVQCMDQK